MTSFGVFGRLGGSCVWGPWIGVLEIKYVNRQLIYGTMERKHLQFYHSINKPTDLPFEETGIDVKVGYASP